MHRPICLVALLGLIPILAAGAEEKLSPEEVRAGAALKRILDQEQALRGQPDKLRQMLFGMRLAHPGTRAAVRAAARISELPSPLDRLEARTIAPLEKFDWQPKELVGVLGEHRGRHGSAVASVAFSSDSRMIASGGGGLVRTWDAATMRLLGTAHSGAATSSVAFTKDGKVLVAGNHYGGVYVYNLLKDKPPALRFAVAAATSPVYQVACHPNNKLIAAACHDNVVRVWDVTGKEIKEVGQVTGHKNAVRSLAFSPDGKTLATGSDDLTARVWNMTTLDYKEVSRLEGHAKPVTAVAFSPSGKTLATGCADGTVRLWNVPAAARARTPRTAFEVAKSGIASLNFSKSGNTLAVACGDAKVRLWSMSGKAHQAFALEGHKGAVTGAAYSPDMRLLVSGAADWTVRTWDLTRSTGRKPPPERFVPWSHLSHVYAAAFATDSRSVASGSYDTIVRFWDLDRPEPRTRNYLPFDNAHVYSIAYSPDGRLVAAGGHSTTIRQWDAITGRVKPPCKNLASHTYTITYSPDSKYLLAASLTNVVLYDSARGSEVKRFGEHKTNVHCIGFSPDARLAYSGSGNYLYDKMNKLVIRNGKYVWTDCYLKLWDVEKGEEAEGLRIKEADTPFYAASFSADGRMLFAGNYDVALGKVPTLRRWQVGTKQLKELEPWKGASGYAHGIWPTPDGKYLLTRGLDGLLVLWDLAGGKRLRQWTFSEQMGGVAVAGDSRHVAVGLGTGVIYVLRLRGGPGSETGKGPVRGKAIR